eukprot:PhM_4_TR17377/c3_g1_i1/m.22394
MLNPAMMWLLQQQQQQQQQLLQQQQLQQQLLLMSAQQQQYLTMLSQQQQQQQQQQQANTTSEQITCFACRGVGHKATQCPAYPRPVVPTSERDVVVLCAIHGKPRTSKNMFFNNSLGVWQCFSETTCKNLSASSPSGGGGVDEHGEGEEL